MSMNSAINKVYSAAYDKVERTILALFFNYILDELTWSGLIYDLVTSVRENYLFFF